MRHALAALVVATALVAGCGGPPPSGSITALSYVPAHRGNVEVDDYTLLCYGNPLMCFEQYVGSHWEERSFEAQWNAVLERCPAGKCETHLLGITREQYGAWSVGDWYPAILKYEGLRR